MYVDPNHRTWRFDKLREVFFVVYFFVQVIGRVLSINMDLVVASRQQKHDFFACDGVAVPHDQFRVGELVRGETQLHVQAILCNVVDVKVFVFFPLGVDVEVKLERVH